MKGEGSFLTVCPKALRHKGKKEVGISMPSPWPSPKRERGFGWVGRRDLEVCTHRQSLGKEGELGAALYGSHWYSSCGDEGMMSGLSRLTWTGAGLARE